MLPGLLEAPLEGAEQRTHQGTIQKRRTPNDEQPLEVPGKLESGLMRVGDGSSCQAPHLPTGRCVRWVTDCVRGQRTSGWLLLIVPAV